MKKVLAIDMGATSIRGIISYRKDDSLYMEEVMRISHTLEEKDGRLRWQWDKLLGTIVETIIKYSSEISSVAIDTWGVDFGYLDDKGDLINTPIAYRDPKHSKGYKLAISKLSEEDIFRNTGTQIMNINTVFQILALRDENKEEYQKINKILMLPDLLSYILCGQMVGEETIWSTSGIMNLETRDYSKDILEALDIDRGILPQIVKAGSVIGSTKNSKIEELSKYDIKVISVCGHDTASAVLLTKAFIDEDYMFLSCGTWSLFGAKVEKADLSKEAYTRNLTNELGYDSKTLLFKNITGLYLLEKYKSQLEDNKGKKIDFSEITSYVLDSLDKEKDFDLIIDMDDERFASPDVIAKKAIDEYLLEKGKDLPKTDMDYFRIIYESLVDKYLQTKKAVEERTGKSYKKLHLIGGGAKSELLCKLIALRLNVDIIAGPFEASALGNILLQLKAVEEINSIEEGLDIAFKSQEMKHFNV